MKEILEMKLLAPECPVRVATIPKQILKEIDLWVKESKKIKNNPLARLKAHQNVAYYDTTGESCAFNSYQTSISPYLIEQSYWLAWVLRLTAKYWGKGHLMHRHFKMRKWDGHFDGYDIWTNFSYRGNQNPSHNHGGVFSGVIYYKNHGHPTVFDDYDCEYEGKDGTMVMFPADTIHHVNPQFSNSERITLAFNISYADPPKQEFLEKEVLYSKMKNS